MSLNREQRRRLKKALAPLARDIATLEKALKEIDDPELKKEIEAEIDKIMSQLSIMEMMAIEDYIASKKLLD